jgi:hypothetical protein
MRAGQRSYVTVDYPVLCAACVAAADAVRLAGGLTAEVREVKLLVRRGAATGEVLPCEVHHLVNALVEAAGRFVDTENSREVVKQAALRPT